MSAQKRSGHRGGHGRKGSLPRPAGKPAVPPGAPIDSPEPGAPRNHRELAEAIAAKCDLVEVGCDLLEAESESVKARVFETRDWYAQTVEREGGAASLSAGVPALGPYPRRGEYEHCFTLSAAERKRAIEERERRNDRDYDDWAWDVLGSGGPAFQGLPFVTVP